MSKVKRADFRGVTNISVLINVVDYSISYVWSLRFVSWTLSHLIIQIFAIISSLGSFNFNLNFHTLKKTRMITF